MATMTRGARHPHLAGLLAGHEPAATREVSWLGGTMPLRVSACPGNS